MDDVHCLDADSQSPNRDENSNMSDVIEVIETDPDFNQNKPTGRIMASNNWHQAVPLEHQHHGKKRQAVVRIVEQPASKSLRFRYECEGRSAGSIPGVSSTAENKTYPSIKIDGYKGKAVVLVSCVTKEKPYRPHPHNLVGREGCKKGVCTLEIPPEAMSITFPNLGIQCVKKKDIESHLRVREEIKVDPFKTGYSHRNQPTSIDLNAVRLCFQVFILNSEGKYEALVPIVSDPIFDKKSMSDLVIVKLSDCVSTVDGGRKELILLCEKVAKEDIQIRFYEEKDGVVVWEGFADFQPSQVHKQAAISFRTPRYKTLDITEPVKVNIQLLRPSDNATSEPLPFEFLPLDAGVKRKRKLEPDTATANPLRHMQDHDQSRRHYIDMQEFIKTEPLEVQTPFVSPACGGASPSYLLRTPRSPQQLYMLPIESTPPLVNTTNELHAEYLPPTSNLPLEQEVQTPYVSPAYRGASPSYPAGSPQQYYGLRIEATPPLVNATNEINSEYNPRNNLHGNALPSMNTWNHLPTSNLNQASGTNYNSYHNMDTHITEIDSNDLLRLEYDENMLAENLSNNLSLTDFTSGETASDNLNKIMNETYKKMNPL